MAQAAVSDVTLALVHQWLMPGEQILWAGKPEPTVPLSRSSRALVPTVKFTVPVFILGLIVGLAFDRPILYTASIAGIFLFGFVTIGHKYIRAMPVAHEEYVLTNWRAFSHFQSNGTRIIGEVLLDENTLIQKRRCGHGTSTLVFSRSQNAAEPRKVKRLGRACVALLNLRDIDYPLKIAEWAVATNPVPQTSAPPTVTNLGRAWTQN